MASNKSLIILIVIGLVIIIGAAAFLIFNPLRPAEQEAGITPPAATGKLSDLKNALDEEVTDEMNLVYDGDDASLITSDADLINDFSQSADDPEL
jgi:flagellar basal body-associated protein FliL